MKKDFLELLKATSGLDRHSRWSETKKRLDSDPRYKAVESSTRREDYFRDYVKQLKESKRDKDHDKDRDKHRDKDRDKDRDRSGRDKDRDRDEKSRGKSRDVDKQDEVRVVTSTYRTR